MHYTGVDREAFNGVWRFLGGISSSVLAAILTFELIARLDTI